MAKARGRRLIVSDPDNLATVIEATAPRGLRTEQALERYARTLSPGIRDDGLRKVLDGVSTLEEVVRVTRDD